MSDALLAAARAWAAEDPDPVAVRLDLRPWGKGPKPAALSEEGGTGLAPRADVW